MAVYGFSALTLLVGRQEEQPACKNWVMRCWCGYLSEARCRLFACVPADATPCHSLHFHCNIPSCNSNRFFPVTKYYGSTAADSVKLCSQHKLNWTSLSTCMGLFTLKFANCSSIHFMWYVHSRGLRHNEYPKVTCLICCTIYSNLGRRATEA